MSMMENNEFLRDFGAVLVKNGVKFNGNECVMSSMNMAVPRNSIYVLCGASGCGKTTLLKSLLCLTYLDFGEIQIYGEKVDEFEGKIGFMPQELALYEDLTVKENLMFFGRIYGIKEKVLRMRIRFFVTLFELPDVRSQISTLSSGQQRRVSLTVSLLHQPQLLILDEPTVGFDILIRDKVWRYFKELSKNQQTTIIISTHDMNEAMKGDLVAFMSHKKIIVENSPRKLLEKFESDSLTEVFCAIARGVKNEENFQCDLTSTNTKKKKKKKIQHFKAISVKNFLTLKKHLGISLILLLMPILQLFLIFFAIGHFPNEFPIAVVDRDGGCNNISLFLDFVAKRESCFEFIPHKTAITAMNNRRSEGTYILLEFTHNLTKMNVYELKNQHFFMATIKETISKLFLDFLEIHHGLMFRSPLPTTQTLKINWFYYSFPGSLIFILFYWSLVSSSVNILYTQTPSTIDRCHVMKVSNLDFLIVHFFHQLLIVLIYSIECLIFTIFSFENLEFETLVVIWIEYVLMGICGLLSGTLITKFLKNDTSVMSFVVLLFYIMMFLNSILWPLEGAPLLAQNIAKFFPIFRPIEALRLMLNRGVFVVRNKIFMAFGNLICWNFSMFLILIFMSV